MINRESICDLCKKAALRVGVLQDQLRPGKAFEYGVISRHQFVRCLKKWRYGKICSKVGFVYPNDVRENQNLDGRLLGGFGFRMDGAGDPLGAERFVHPKQLTLLEIRNGERDIRGGNRKRLMTCGYESN